MLNLLLGIVGQGKPLSYLVTPTPHTEYQCHYHTKSLYNFYSFHRLHPHNEYIYKQSYIFTFVQSITHRINQSNIVSYRFSSIRSRESRRTISMETQMVKISHSNTPFGNIYPGQSTQSSNGYLANISYRTFRTYR